MRVLLTGAGGQVGQAIRSLKPAGMLVTALTHADLDITNADRVRDAVGTHRPQWIINAAAFTAVDAAESERDAAHALNATAVSYLARAANSQHGRLVQLSTDFVFDGRSSVPYEPESDTLPLNVYGASKLAGEQNALRESEDSIVVRTSWVYAAHGTNFVRTMLRLMALQPEVRVVCDQVGSPTWATGLARALWRLIDRAAPAGIYHWCDAGITSWYDFAVAIQEEALLRGLLGQQRSQILPVRTTEYPTAARRPAYSALDASRMRTMTDLPVTHWRVHLRTMLDELATA